MAKNKKEIIYFPYVGAKLNDDPFDLSRGDYSWTHKLKQLADKNGIEIHTPDTAKYKNVIGVLFFDNVFYRNTYNLELLREKNLLSKTIYIDYEPPTGHAKKHEPESIERMSRMFKYVITYDDNLAKKNNFIKGNVANYHSEKVGKSVEFDNKKLVCMVTSNTTNEYIISVLNDYNYTRHYNSKNIKYHPNANYHSRIKIAEYFAKQHPEDFELYGLMWPKHLDNVNKGFLGRDKKISKMSEYKFAITFDSYINQSGYVSEKIFDAFFAGVVPVYWGASNVLEYIPEQCFIDMRNFKSYEDLYDYIAGMRKDEYDSRLCAIKDFLASEKFLTHFSSEGIAMTLYDALVRPGRADYNTGDANEILDELLDERSKISGVVGVIGVDKVEVDGLWCFKLYVTPGEYTLSQISQSIYVRTRKGVTKLKSKYEKYCDVEKYDTLSVTIPYRHIVDNSRAWLELRVKGSNIRTIPIFDKSTIEDTIYDHMTVFRVYKNMIYLPPSARRLISKVRNKLNAIISRI